MQTTEARFMEMLDILPPQNWIQGTNWEMFQVGEESSGNNKGFTYATFLRVGGSYYELGDHNEVKI